MRGADTDPWSITLEVNLGSGMMDLGSRTSPVRQKVRDACHGGTLVFDQVVTGLLKNYMQKPR